MNGNTIGQSNINMEPFQNMVNVSEVHLNVSQEVIITTEDKLKLCLSQYLEKMEVKNSWIAPLGVLLTIIVTIITSTFKEIGLSADTWKAIFIVFGIICSGWLISAIMKSTSTMTVEDIIKELKKDSK
jgi:uncharacterized membrane protein YqjE